MATLDAFINRHIDSKPKERVGIGGFWMLATVNESINMNSKIPTAWLEDGSAAQDHIVLDPTTITIDGEVSDIWIERNVAMEAITRTQAQIGTIATYLPTRTQSQVQKINAITNDATDKIREIERAYENGKQLAGFFGVSNAEKNIREQFIDHIESIHYGKVLISIETPYRVYDNMALPSIQINRDNQFEALTFKITAQKMRFADVVYADINEYFKKPGEGTEGKLESASGKGPQKPEEVDKSVLTAGKDMLTYFYNLLP